MEINGYPNYLIYKDGRVFSKKRNRVKTGKFLKPYPNSDGYLLVEISTNEYLTYRVLLSIKTFLNENLNLKTANNYIYILIFIIIVKNTLKFIN